MLSNAVAISESRIWTFRWQKEEEEEEEEEESLFRADAVKEEEEKERAITTKFKVGKDLLRR